VQTTESPEALEKQINKNTLRVQPEETIDHTKIIATEVEIAERMTIFNP